MDFLSFFSTFIISTFIVALTWIIAFLRSCLSLGKDWFLSLVVFNPSLSIRWGERLKTRLGSPKPNEKTHVSTTKNETYSAKDLKCKERANQVHQATTFSPSLFPADWILNLCRATLPSLCFADSERALMANHLHISTRKQSWEFQRGYNLSRILLIFCSEAVSS